MTYTPPDVSSVLHAFWQHAETQPDLIAFSSGALDDDGRAAEEVTFQEMAQRVRSMAAHLAAAGVGPDDRVVVMLPNCINYVVSVLSAMAAGAIAVPLFPPGASTHGDRIEAVMIETLAAAVISASKTLPQVTATLETLHIDNCVVLDEDVISADDQSDAFVTQDVSDVAFLQYTSGSTSTPKGVMVTQQGLIANSNAIGECFGHIPGQTGVCWLPLFHDMGLVGSVFHPVHWGGTVYLMKPSELLRSPAKWFEAISKLGASTSGGPNFAFDWCVDKVKDSQMEGLDLSSWKAAYNGSEPVHIASLERFAERFGQWGFSRDALLPCYGLAEFTLLVTGSSLGTEGMVRSFAADQLMQGKAVPVEEGGRSLVACGSTLEGRTLRIVNSEGVEAAPGELGDILVAGPDRASGYWRNASASEATFGLGANDPHPEFLRTGDVGFVLDGQLFVTGRVKEMILVRGKNLYPHDLEETALSALGTNGSMSAAAFPIATERGEELGLAVEVPKNVEDLAGDARKVRLAIAETTGVQPRAIVLVGKRSLPKTSSGKLRRVDIAQLFARSELDVVFLDEMILGEGSRERPDLATPYREPKAGLEQTVAAVWSSVLKIAEVGADDDFLELGGDSLGAAMIATELGSVFGVTVELSDLFETHTIAEVAAMIESEMGSTAEDDDDMVEIEL